MRTIEGITAVLYRFSEEKGPMLMKKSGELSDGEKSEIESLLFIKDEETLDNIELEKRELLYHLRTKKTPWMKGGGEEYYLLGVIYDRNKLTKEIRNKIDLEELDRNFFQVCENNWKGFYRDEEGLVDEQGGDMDEVDAQWKKITNAFDDFCEDFREVWEEKKRITEEEAEAIVEKGKVSTTRVNLLTRKELLLFVAIFFPIYDTASLTFWGFSKRLWEARMVDATYTLFGTNVAVSEIQAALMAIFAGITALCMTRVKDTKKILIFGILGYVSLFLVTLSIIFTNSLLWLHGPLSGVVVPLVLIPLGAEFAKNTAPKQRGRVVFFMLGITFLFGILFSFLSFIDPGYTLLPFLAGYVISAAAFYYYFTHKDDFDHETKLITVHDIGKKSIWLIIVGYFIVMVSSTVVPWDVESFSHAFYYNGLEMVGLGVAMIPFLRWKHFNAKTSYLVGAISIGISVLLFALGIKGSNLFRLLGLGLNGLGWGVMLGITIYIMWINSYDPENSRKWIGVAAAVFYTGLAIGGVTGRYLSGYFPQTTIGFIAVFLTYIGILPVVKSKDTSRMRIVG